ncbi:hypothetical protein SDJN03_27309, partial [Cucurbita argyrosperma subsp. sororia]
MLTRCNYAAWVIKMEVFMMAQGVWETIESPKTVDNRKDKMALAIIYQKNIDEYSGKLTIIVNKLRDLNNTVDDIQVVKKLLRSSTKFLQITSTIEEFSDLKTKSVDKIIGSAKAHEERLQGFGEKDETILLSRAEWKG